MEEGADEFFTSPADLCNSMPDELSWWPPRWSDNCLWVFWNRRDDELPSISLPGCSVDKSSSGNRTIEEKIKAFLRYSVDISSGNKLVQFWEAVQTGVGFCLTTANQPFGLNNLHKRLCLYRRLCLEIPIHMSQLGDQKTHNLFPIERVFRRGLIERCSNVNYYLNEEYPLRDYAIQLGIKSYMVLPLFELSGKHCVGVLEILSTVEQDASLAGDSSLSDIQHRGLKAHAALLPERHIFEDLIECKSACKDLKAISRSHQLSLNQVWVANSTTRCINRIFGSRVNLRDWLGFYYMSYDWPGCDCLWEGEGVVGKAFASRGACFCKNVSELRVSVYPWVSHARRLGLTGCFAVCLQSTQIDYFYILEFFLPPSEINYADPRNFLSMLVNSVKKDILFSASAPLQRLGKNLFAEKLFVEVIKVSSDDKLDSFEICPPTYGGSTPWVFKHPEERERMQHDNQLLQAIRNILKKYNDVVGPSTRSEFLHNTLELTPLQQTLMEPVAVNKDGCIASGKQSEIAISCFGAPPLFAGESTSSKALYQGGTNTILTHRKETTQEDTTAEQNVSSQSPPGIQFSPIRGVVQPDYINKGNLNVCQDASTGARKQGQVHASAQISLSAVNGIHEENVARIEQDDNNVSRKQVKVRTLDAKYRISREVLEQHSGKKLKEVADILGISRSTLKRICRKNHIFRWPPCKIKKFRPFVNSQVSNQATQSHTVDTRQMNHPLPQEMHSASKMHSMAHAIDEVCHKEVCSMPAGSSIHAKIWDYIFNPYYSQKENIVEIGHEYASRQEMTTLGPRKWLQDVVINLVVNMLRVDSGEKNLSPAQRIWYMPTYFAVKIQEMDVAYLAMDRYGGEINSCCKIFIPMNVNNQHWFCLLIDFIQRKVFVLDSLPNQSHDAVVQEVVQAFDNGCRHAFGDKYMHSVSSYVVETPKLAEQINSYDCGIYLVNFMKASDVSKMKNIKFESDSERFKIASQLVMHEKNLRRFLLERHLHSQPRNSSSPSESKQRHSLPQQSVAVDDIHGENVVRIEQNGANDLRKQGRVEKLDREREISHEIREQRSGKRLEDVAGTVQISRSTPSKAKRLRPSVDAQPSIHASEVYVEDQGLTNQPSMPDLCREKYSVSKPVHATTEEQNSSSIMVKATYRDDTIKFLLSLSSGKLDLEKEVAMRLNFSAGSFKLKYLDEDGDWVLVTCDTDLRTCMRTLRSAGKTTVKMLILV